MACKFKQDGNPRWCTTIQGECQFLTADDGPKCYLESTGTQWIDTGINLAATMIVKSAYQVFNGSDNNPCPFSLTLALGRRYSVISSSGSTTILLDSGSSAVAGYFIANDENVHTLEFDLSGMQTLYFDGAEVSSRGRAFTAVAGRTVKLFVQSSTSAQVYGHGRVMSFSVTDATTGQKIQDLIPVRKDGVGYMYDRVSGQLLGNSGTGDFVLGPDKPYDHEVAYIERDFSIPWMTAGGEIATDDAGFVLSQYAGGTVATWDKRFSATFSFSPDMNGIAYCAGLGNGNLVTALAFGKASGINSPDSATYSAKYGRAFRHPEPAVSGDLATFHTMELRPPAPDYSIAIDGDVFLSGAASSSSISLSFFYVLYCTGTSNAALEGCKMRVKSVVYGSSVYLIPVVKGNAVGFYNMVDGELFLEEQACLTAGPVV